MFVTLESVLGQPWAVSSLRLCISMTSLGLGQILRQLRHRQVPVGRPVSEHSCLSRGFGSRSGHAGGSLRSLPRRQLLLAAALPEARKANSRHFGFRKICLLGKPGGHIERHQAQAWSFNDETAYKRFKQHDRYRDESQ